MDFLRDRTPDPSDPATVLVVEDERELADLFTAWLADRYRVRTAYNGEQALSKLNPEVDVVLLDRRMPDMAGDEVLGRIRERDGEYQVAMVTAVDPDFDILKLDFDEYVTKPVSREDLRETVERLVTRGAFESDLQRALALAAKKATLEDEKSAAELQGNTTYEVLVSELARYREQVDDQLTRLGERDANSYVRYATSRILLDGLVIGLVAAVLVGIHLGVPDARQRLLAYGSPDSNLLVSYLLTFVHHGDVHLYGNVVGYLIGAFVTYALCMRIRALRWFYLTAPLLLTLLPIGTGVVSTMLFGLLYPNTETVLLGFSTVVAGFVGFAYLALLFVARGIYDHRTTFFIGLFILLALVDSLLWIDRSQWLVATGIGTVLVFIAIIKAVLQGRSGQQGGVGAGFRRLIGLVAVTVFFTGVGLGLFPAVALTAAESTSSSTTNVFGHFLGVLVGFVIAFSTAFVADVFPIRERIRREGYAPPDRLL